MTIYNANVSNIRRGLVDCVDPEDDPPFADTDVHPIAWYQEGGAGGPFAMRVHDSIMAAAIDVDLNAIAASLATLVGVSSPIKEAAYTAAADVTLPGTGVETWIIPWVDVSAYRWLGWWVRNTGANPYNNLLSYLSRNAAGDDAWSCTVVAGIGSGGCLWGDTGTPWSATWNTSAPCPFIGYRMSATSTFGTTVRVYIIGMK